MTHLMHRLIATCLILGFGAGAAAAADKPAAPLDTGAGYQSGIANLRGIVGGYLAGGHAASR